MTDEDDTARVRAYEADKDAINERRQGTETQAEVIRRLLDGEGDTDTDTDTSDDLADGLLAVSEATKDEVEAIKAELEATDRTAERASDGPTFDDMKAACAAAIRDELGEVLDR